jgi:hypothetical protein
MINKQFAMSSADVKKFNEVKESSLYKDYITNIINSPTYVNMANEHVKNIDISEDVEDIIANNQHPAKKLNTLFKDTLKGLAIHIIADSLIFKDIIDISFEDALEELEDNFKVKYLMGLADTKYYEKAEKVIEESSDSSSLIYLGYVEYKKRVDKGIINNVKVEDIAPTLVATPTKKKTKNKAKKKTIDISSNDISL